MHLIGTSALNLQQGKHPQGCLKRALTIPPKECTSSPTRSSNMGFMLRSTSATASRSTGELMGMNRSCRYAGRGAVRGREGAVRAQLLSAGRSVVGEEPAVCPCD